MAGRSAWAHRLAAKAAARPVARLMPAALRHAGCPELTHALAGTAPSSAKREVTEAPSPRTWHVQAELWARGCGQGCRQGCG